MSLNDANKFVTNRDLESELRSFRWEVRCLILIAMVVSSVLPVAPGDIARALIFF